MALYYTQPTPPAGAYQTDIGALATALDPVTRSGGVVGPTGRGHGNLHPSQAQALAINGTQRGIDFGALTGRQPQNPGLEL